MADALAQRLEGHREEASPWATALRELGAVDRATYAAVAETPTPSLDEPIRRLSNAANNSRLWLGIAAALAALGGRRGRRAALEGAVAIGVTSATVNLLAKSIAARPRPDRQDLDPFPSRAVPMPASSSFPSGHAASAFAFSYAVGRHMPGARGANPASCGRRRLLTGAPRRALSERCHGGSDDRLGDRGHALVGRGSPRDHAKPANRLNERNYRRAGFYTYAMLDNAGYESAHRVLPESQDPKVGEWMPMSKKVNETTAFKVKAFEPSRWLLWEKPDSTWSWKLVPMDGNRTRLLTRLKQRYAWEKPASALSALVLLEFGDFPMI